jgi:hypothetical protein
MKKLLFRIIIICILVFSWSSSAFADWKSDIGYTALQSELGANLPTGAGVKVTQVEASSGMPDTSNPEFSGKTFTQKNLYLSVSGHATTVGQLFYGNSSSIAPGITSIDDYDASFYTGTAFLGWGTGRPLISSSRVANHSWVGALDATSTVNILARLDWVIDRDEFIQAVGMNNGGTNSPLLGSSFDSISVGLSNGGAAHSAYPLTTTPTTPYASASRTKPDLVVPQSATSWATPIVASAAALLVQEGHQAPSLSTDPVSVSTTNRNGDTIYNAERSETVKAALMAGASRTSSNLSNYTINTDNGLNNVLGAGELNILNSYHIIAEGEQNSLEDQSAGSGIITKTGFDYDPQFGGSSSSNRTGTYVFRALTSGTLSASLVWNLNVAGGADGSFDTTATLSNLGLYLYDTTTSSEVAHYTSAVDNTQNIWLASLVPNHNYMLEVKAESPDNFLWDYALAWNINADVTSPRSPTYSREDINQDSKVDITDFNILKSDFLKTTANLSNPRSDINGDGQATVKDVGILMSGWSP